ncbi:MAG: prolyl oligopeptidase family serine peptidase [Planctomycetota bacterium]
MTPFSLTAWILLLAAAPVSQPAEWKVGPAQSGGRGRVLFAPSPMLKLLTDDPDAVPELYDVVKPDEKDRVAHESLANGWAYTVVQRRNAGCLLVEGRGLAGFYVNGEPFPGDPYRSGILRVPIPLREGENRVLVRATRGSFTFRLLPAEGPASLSPHDPTLPDLREGFLLSGMRGAVIVLNHTGETIRMARLVVGDDTVFAMGTATVRHLLPHGMEKTAFRLRQKRAPKPGELDEKGRYLLPVELRIGSHVHALEYPMSLRKGADAYRETRLSPIDDSVQIHAVRPPAKIEKGKTYALFLSLHGASVRAWNQANAYAPKRDAFVVAPTNRRPYGFDWQDWGRADAIEALDYALANLPVDPTRVYLTGHSMGGHGTWYVGALHAGRFAAIAPSAGWSSFFHYGGGLTRDLGDAAALDAFEATQTESDTEAFLTNLTRTPIYVLHGEKDDNVPVSEAKRMLKALSGFHREHVYHEQPGAGHWWGDECVDWIPLFEFCRKHRRVEHPLEFTFSTFNPAVASKYAWVTIFSQLESGKLSTVKVAADPREATVDITTENVALLDVDFSGVVPARTVTVTIDGQEMELLSREPCRFRIAPNRAWGVGTSKADAAGKNPIRAGPFKRAFGKHMVWVYGTGGTDAMRAATLARVRADAYAWWYRGNGRVRILADTAFDAAAYAGRNVVLYGNADTNRAFSILDPACPVTAKAKQIRVGRATFKGDLGTCFVFPGNGGALVGVVGATSGVAMRRMFSTRHFVSGVAIPDWVVFDGSTLEQGMDGVKASGYFSRNWALQ